MKYIKLYSLILFFSPSQYLFVFYNFIIQYTIFIYHEIVRIILTCTQQYSEFCVLNFLVKGVSLHRAIPLTYDCQM